MKKFVPLLMGAVGLIGLMGSTCTSTFTEADLQEIEKKNRAAAVAEEKRDEQIGEQGGANEKAIQEQIDAVDGGIGADF